MKNGQSQRITIRLTPFQARQLWMLRNAGLPAGTRPRTATEVLIRALLDASKASAADGASRPTPVATHGDAHGNGHDAHDNGHDAAHSSQNAA